MRLGLVLCIAIGCANTPAPATPVTLTAPQIFARAAKTYASARSYADRGTSLAVDSQGQRFNQAFTTAFVRPDRFRFEYREEGEASRARMIWLDAGVAYATSYEHPGRASAYTDLAVPLTAAANVSSALTVLIPSLLAATDFAVARTALAAPPLGPFLDAVSKPTVAGEDTVGGRACWRVTGELAETELTLWIDRESYLIRRIATDALQIEYEPRIDVTLAAAELAGPDLIGLAIEKRTQPKWIGVLFEEGSNRVREVLPGSPAARAGIRAGDRMVTLAGATIAGVSDVIRAVQEHAAGDRLDIELDRGGSPVKAAVTVDYRPDLEKLQQTKLVDQAAPTFELATPAGGTIKLTDLKGKVVVLDFWASWCKPCIASMPKLNEWHRTLGPKGVAIVGVTDDEPDAVRDTIAEHKLAYAIALDTKREAWRDYLVQGLPTTAVIDKAGVIRYVSIGAGDEAAIEAMILKLLK